MLIAAAFLMTVVPAPAPSEREMLDAFKGAWEPGWRDGITTEVNHVPQNHPVGKTYGLSGNILGAQAIGGF